VPHPSLGQVGLDKLVLVHGDEENNARFHVGGTRPG
jgi:hypothetical protein